VGLRQAESHGAPRAVLEGQGSCRHRRVYGEWGAAGMLCHGSRVERLRHVLDVGSSRLSSEGGEKHSVGTHRPFRLRDWTLILRDGWRGASYGACCCELRVDRGARRAEKAGKAGVHSDPLGGAFGKGPPTGVGCCTSVGRRRPVGLADVDGFRRESPGESRVSGCRPRRTHTTDIRMEKYLEVDPTNAVGNGGGVLSRSDVAKAVRVGNTLEGVASAGTFPASSRQRRAETETW